MNIYNTYTLLEAVKGLNPITSFLKDRYFPTNEATDIFSTEEVLVEYRDGSKKLAPFVSPRANGVTLTRKGHHMERFEPANIAPKRAISIDDLKKKGFGEALYSKLTPEQRETVYVLQDSTELDESITRTEEYMAAQALLNNGYTMKYLNEDGEVAEEKQIQFYTEDANPATYTPATAWSDPTADILGDIAAMAKLLTSRGLPATELLVSPDVADYIINNTAIKELLNNRRYELGGVNPEELPTGAVKIARLNCKGRLIDVISYDATYTDENEANTQYLPEGTAILTAPACGHTAYGAVTQLEQTDGQFHTYAEKRVPKFVANANSNVRTLTLTSCPLVLPHQKNAWIYADVD